MNTSDHSSSPLDKLPDLEEIGELTHESGAPADDPSVASPDSAPPARRVVFVPGMSRPASDADEFFPLLPDGLTTVSVGRPLKDAPFDLGAAVDEIIAAAGDDPVVLVAHSFGAYLAELAAHKMELTNPGQVVSLVLLDPSITDVPDPLMIPNRLWQLWRPAIRATMWAARRLPEGSQLQLRLAQMGLFLRENAAFRSTAKFVRAVRAAGGPAVDAVPSVVVSALNPGNMASRKLRRNSWVDQHSTLAAQLHANHVSISPSTHLVFNDHPEKVAEIVETYC